jgi:hypothetical protein
VQQPCETPPQVPQAPAEQVALGATWQMPPDDTQTDPVVNE